MVFKQYKCESNTDNVLSISSDIFHVMYRKCVLSTLYKSFLSEIYICLYFGQNTSSFSDDALFEKEVRSKPNICLWIKKNLFLLIIIIIIIFIINIFTDRLLDNSFSQAQATFQYYELLKVSVTPCYRHYYHHHRLHHHQHHHRHNHFHHITHHINNVNQI